MKTLDEVIELCEKALWCAYLPQDDTTTTAGLALYYLREYREMKEHLACLDAVALHGEDTQRVNNPALTWDELKSMEGKPVWVEEYDPIDEKTGWHTASWKLIEFINDEYFDVRDSDGEQECFYKSENDWHAYRKERG